MKMWDGRFSAPTAELMERFNNSLPFDKVLIEEDIDGSIAWTKALAAAAIFTPEEQSLVCAALEQIRIDYRQGTIQFSARDEDIHMAVERLLVERIGEPGSRLHTGRSRNDQVATDFRLYVKKRLHGLIQNVVMLQHALLQRAQDDAGIVISGYTHLQQAQPVLLAHYWLSFFFVLQREKKRLSNAAECADCMPLGSGAIAGAGFPVDRELLARELGFARISENSMDAVASRDFVLEALASCASLGIQLSRYAEDLIIWSSREFGFVELSDAWSTGSSMMPQKKNPDSLELIRGKSGRFVGNYMRFATTLKGIGLTYFKDLQEDKEPLFDSAEQMALVLEVFAHVAATLTVNATRIEQSLDPFLFATDVADYLVQKGLAFRQAHKVVGLLVGFCVNNHRPLNELSVEEFKTFSPLFQSDVLNLFNWQAALKHRDLPGGTGPDSVAHQLQTARALLST